MIIAHVVLRNDLTLLHLLGAFVSAVGSAAPQRLVAGLEVGRGRRCVRTEVSRFQGAFGLTAGVRTCSVLLSTAVRVPEAKSVPDLVHEH